MEEKKKVIVKTVQCQYCSKWFSRSDSMKAHIVTTCKNAPSKAGVSCSTAADSSLLQLPAIRIPETSTIGQMPTLTPIALTDGTQTIAIELSHNGTEIEPPEKRVKVFDSLPDTLVGTENVDNDPFSFEKVMEKFEAAVANDRIRFRTLFQQMAAHRGELDSGKEVPDFLFDWPRMASNLREMGLEVTAAAEFKDAKSQYDASSFVDEQLLEQLDRSMKDFAAQNSPNEPTTSRRRKDSKGKLNVVIKAYDQSLVQVIKSCIVTDPDPWKWNDVIGLEEAKQAIQEAVIGPLTFPELYTNRYFLKREKGILLYGPPGTGKTMLAKCAAFACNATFFSVSAADINSKYIGESEKLMKLLFEYAAALPRAIIFVDEIDSLMGARNDNDDDASVKLKTAFLAAFDGFSGTSDVLVMGTTNRPQALDTAAARRFTNYVYVPMPSVEVLSCLMKIVYVNCIFSLFFKIKGSR